MKPFYKKTTLLVLLSLFITFTGYSQYVQEARKYRVIAYKNGDPSVTSTSNTVQVIPYMSIYIPNSFTPNGDGLNDTFGAHGEAIMDYHMQVFNRWGQMVFETTNYNARWDGTYDGTQVPQGLYVYKVSAKGITGKRTQKDGTVTVVY